MRATVLGCGWSGGVPLVGCDCAVCRSDDPRNRRLRCSVLVEGDAGQRLLIDASPDLRQQLLDASVSRLDGILMTHAHADHCHGIDDLRLICRAMAGSLDLFGDRATLDELKTRFGYAFTTPREATAGWLSLVPHEIAGPFVAGGLAVRPFRQAHGTATTTLGFRIGSFAYSTDLNGLDDAAFQVLEGVDVWVVDCQGVQPSPVHSHLDLTLAWIERVRPRRAVLTHLGHDFDFADLARRLPPGVEPARDGLELRCGP